MKTGGQKFLTTNIPFKPNRVHLWFAFPDEIKDTELLAEYHALLTPTEREQQRRYRFARHRHQYLVARATVRTVLSRYTDILPDRLEFSKNQYGRPDVILPSGSLPIRFNLSHTRGLIALGVVQGQEIGIDVEHVDRKVDVREIAARFFSKTEINHLLESAPEVQKKRFLDYWTLKESYIKARGMGLSLPLDQFSFHLPENEPVRISFGPGISDNPNYWQFWLLRPTPLHTAAVSLCCGNSEHFTLTTQKTVPLQKTIPFKSE